MAPRALRSLPPKVAAHGDPSSRNALVRGDNLDVLAALAARFGGTFRCIYLDPPFNTGRRFVEYEDLYTPEAWRSMMRARLLAMVPLLRPDGAIVAEIDDTELGSLLTVMDEVFGRENRVSTITVVRSAATGHKAKNRGPVNVTDYVLVYAMDKSAWRATPLVRRRDRRDPAYATHLLSGHEPPARWQFEPLARAVARELGFESAKGARATLGQNAFDKELDRYALSHADEVVRFAQPRYEAVSVAARRLIDRSREAPESVMVLERARHKPMILRGGNRVLCLADKVRHDANGPYLVEPLTNVWDDIPFQGIAREGGVRFSRNKKPERLLERIIALCTEPGDWVLDPFLGSGTTAAVAHKMGRRYVGIELGGVLERLAVPRLLRVIDGSDTSGISRSLGWCGGGGFALHA